MRARLAGLNGRWWAVLGGGGLLAAFAAGAVSYSATSVGVIKVRFGGDRNQTRVVVETDRPAHGDEAVIGADGKLTISLRGVEAAGDRDGAGDGLVTGWALDRTLGATRLRLALARPSVVKRRFVLAPSEGSPAYRYVIDLAATGPALAPVARTSDRMVRVSTPPVTRRKVIVIDAGHGGHDPGALGRTAREKDITLAAALDLRDRLERTGRYHVVLTRSTDTFVRLENRVQIARHANADLLISLHADSAGDGDANVRGATVYTQSEAVSDRTAHKMFGPGGYFINVALPGRDQSVNRILLDLTQRANKNRSTEFAELLIRQVGENSELRRNSHRDAAYVVLLAPDVPTALLEMGFISNADDEHALTDKGRRARLMGSVATAIDSYFAERPMQLASR